MTESARKDLSRARWIKSTYSQDASTCVEVACNLPGLVAVRDSKHPAGPVLAFSADQWRTFTKRLR